MSDDLTRTEWNPRQIMSTSVGTTMKENTNSLSYVASSQSEHSGRGGFIGFHQNGDYSASSRRSSRRWQHLEGPWFFMSQQMWCVLKDPNQQLLLHFVLFCFKKKNPFSVSSWSLLWLRASGSTPPCSWARASLVRKGLFKDERLRSDCASPLLELLSDLRQFPT